MHALKLCLCIRFVPESAKRLAGHLEVLNELSEGIAPLQIASKHARPRVSALKA